MIAILHNIRSIYNVASIFRTADGLGVEKLYLSGYTPAPVDRFGRKREKFQKVALGAEESVSFQQEDDVLRLIKKLQEDDFTVVACEPEERAVDYRSLNIKPEKTCLVFGNEPAGLEQKILSAADKVVKIPMRGQKSSLNVSVAFGITAAKFIDSKEK